MGNLAKTNILERYCLTEESCFSSSWTQIHIYIYINIKIHIEHKAGGNRLVRNHHVYVHPSPERPRRGSCLMRFLLLRELFESCQVFPAWLNWREGWIVCEEKERGGGVRGLVPWSVFPQVLCYPVLKLEPCGNKHAQVYFMCGTWKVNWGDKLHAE